METAGVVETSSPLGRDPRDGQEPAKPLPRSTPALCPPRRFRSSLRRSEDSAPALRCRSWGAPATSIQRYGEAPKGATAPVRTSPLLYGLRLRGTAAETRSATPVYWGLVSAKMGGPSSLRTSSLGGPPIFAAAPPPRQPRGTSEFAVRGRGRGTDHTGLMGQVRSVPRPKPTRNTQSSTTVGALLPIVSCRGSGNAGSRQCRSAYGRPFHVAVLTPRIADTPSSCGGTVPTPTEESTARRSTLRGQGCPPLTWTSVPLDSGGADLRRPLPGDKGQAP